MVAAIIWIIKVKKCVKILKWLHSATRFFVIVFVMIVNHVGTHFNDISVHNSLQLIESKYFFKSIKTIYLEEYCCAQLCCCCCSWFRLYVKNYASNCRFVFLYLKKINKKKIILLKFLIFSECIHRNYFISFWF